MKGLLNMAFARDLRTTTNQYLAKIRAKDTELEKLNSNKEKYADDYFKQCVDNIQKEKAEIIDKAKIMINLIINSYEESIQNIDDLDGTKLTADFKLLDGKIKLKKQDLEAMFDRAMTARNRTMLRLITEYSKEFNLPINRTYYTAWDKTQGANTLRYWALSAVSQGRYMEFFTNDEYFNNSIPDAIRED